MFKPSLNLSVFNKLDIEGQVDEVNKVLASGMSLNQFGKDIGLDEGAIRKRFKRAGYVRSKEGKKLFELTGDIPTAPISKVIKPKQIKKSEKSIEEKQEIINRASSIGWADMESFMERLVTVENELKAVKEELNVIKDKTINDNAEAHTSYSEGIQMYSEGGILKLKEFTTDLKQISYRYNLEVLYKLNKLCELYPHVSKTKIINTLLNESIDKYLK